MAGQNTHKESDGKSVNVTLTATVTKGDVVYAEGWIGIAAQDGVSGDSIAILIERAEYQFTVPNLLAVSKGDVVYVDTTQVTGHLPDEAGYAKASGANLIPLFKATSDQDANDVVTGVFVGN